jgi:hypothetical protein
MRPSDDETDRNNPGIAEGRRRSEGSPLPRVVRQRVWLHLQSRAWWTLAVVPVEGGMPTHHAARVLAAIAAENGEAFDMLDARGTELDRAPAEVAAAAGGSRRVLVVTRAIEEDLATISLARAADAALLCVSIGSTSLRAAAEATAAIGKDHFLASLSLRACPRKVPGLFRVLQFRGSEA